MRALIIIILLASASNAWSMGQGEDPMVTVDALIAAQRYDEAIRFLAEMVKSYPDRQTEIYAKIQSIMQLRNEYNQKADELILVIVNDPTNMKEKLDRIKELEALEKNPNPTTEAWISDVKETATYTYNKALRDEIFAKGQALLDTGRYAEAIAAYRGGFTLYREEYDERGYGPEITGPVNAAIAAIDAAIAAFPNALAGLQEAERELVAAGESGEVARMDAALAKVEKTLIAYARVRDSLYGAGRTLMDAFEFVKIADKSEKVDNFVVFTYVFTLGHSNETRLEGISGAMDSAWVHCLNSAYTAFSSSLETAGEGAAASFESGDWMRAESEYRRTEGIAGATLGLMGFWSLVVKSDWLETQTSYGRTVTGGKTLDYLAIAHTGKVAAAEAETAKLMKDTLATATSIDGGSSDLAKAKTLRDEIRTRMTNLSGLRARADALEAETALGGTAGYSVETMKSADARLKSHLALISNAGAEAEVWTILTIGKSELDAADAALAIDTAAIAATGPLVEGVPSSNPALEGQTIHLPLEALAKLGVARTDLVAAQTRCDAVIAGLESESAQIRGDPRAAELYERAKLLRAAIAEGIARSDEGIARANELRRQAESARLEADLRMKESREALNRGNFDQARERFDRARERYMTALGFSEDDKLRADSDAALLSLASDIIRLENDAVVKDTMALIARGKEAYYASDFEKASTSFLLARERWAKTHQNDPEPEVENWIKLVNMALTFKTGREIASTDPLYPEMSGRLSAARASFEKGKSFLAQSRRVEAIEAFREAQERLREILLVFPFHQESNILLLQIDLVLDPKAGNDKFVRMYTEAKTKINSDSAASQREGYSDLKTLEAINAGYPGLKTAVYDAEIKLGIRQPPPDPETLRKSDEYAAVAQAIVASNDVTKFPIALEQVNMSLVLNPSNAKAAALKARILGSIGTPDTIALPAAAETMYNEAAKLYQDAYYALANAKMAQMYAKFPQAKTVQKCIELKKKIESKL